MANLVPELRTDSLGRTQRRWVRGQGVTGGNRIPPPAAGAAPAKDGAKRGTLKQKRKRQFDIEFRYDAADAELTDRIGMHHYGYSESTAASFEAKDLEVFDVLSVASPANAALLLKAGARSAGDALSILHEHRLDRLVVDNAAVAAAAEEREVPARDLLAFLLDHPDALSAPTEQCADAAHIYSQLRRLRLLGLDALHKSVLAGTVSVADLRTIGLGTFEGTSAPGALLKALEEIRSGELDCTAEQLRAYLDEGEISAQHTELIDVLRTFGYEWATREGRGSISDAAKIHQRFKDRPLAEQKAAIDYWDRLKRLCKAHETTHIYLLLSEGVQLWEAGVPAEDASQMLAREDTVERIISAHQQGIAGTVSSGWL